MLKSGKHDGIGKTFISIADYESQKQDTLKNMEAVARELKEKEALGWTKDDMKPSLLEPAKVKT